MALATYAAGKELGHGLDELGATRSPSPGSDTASTALSQQTSTERYFSPGSDVTPSTGTPGSAFEVASSAPEADALDTNLNYFHDAARLDEIIVGSFTKIKDISDACGADGKVELHAWQRDETEESEIVVVKRVASARAFVNRGKDANERDLFKSDVRKRSLEDTLNEIGIYRELNSGAYMPQYLLKLYAAFHSASDVWLVLEYADGGDLLTYVQSAPNPVPVAQNLRWAWELMLAVQYMHGLLIGHRDISLENVLIHQGSVRLMDFGQGVQTYAPDGTQPLRYFGTVGKPYYRSPECHVPKQASVQVVAPWGAKPGSVVFAASACGDHLCEVRLPSTASPGQPCAGEPWGYTAALADIFSCGVCIFVVAAGSPPWQQAVLKDPHFKWVHRQGIPKLLKAWKRTLPADFQDLMCKMLSSDPTTRPFATACLEHGCFASFQHEIAPLHKVDRSMAPEAFADPYSDSFFTAGAVSGHVYDPSGAGGINMYDAFHTMGMAGDFYAKEEAHRGEISGTYRLEDQLVGNNDVDCLAGAMDVCCRSTEFLDKADAFPPPPLSLSILREAGCSGWKGKLKKADHGRETKGAASATATTVPKPPATISVKQTISRPRTSPAAVGNSSTQRCRSSSGVRARRKTWGPPERSNATSVEGTAIISRSSSVAVATGPAQVKADLFAAGRRPAGAAALWMRDLRASSKA